MKAKRSAKKTSPALAPTRAARVETSVNTSVEASVERGLPAADLERIRPHVINLRAGRFFASGDFKTSPEDVDAIFSKHLPASGKKKVLFWAHGGLVPEAAALQHVIDHLPGWLEAGVYPIFFVWETGFMTAVRDLIRGAPKEVDRGLGEFLTDISDGLLETALHLPGVPVWGQIKDYARLAGEPAGGAVYTAKKLGAFAAAHPDVEFYACGHSAGSIFHSWFLPAAINEGVRFEDLYLLAPAITTADFEARLSPHFGAGKGIARSTLFTMNERAELADNCFKIYRKSLLYFVSRGFEPEQPTAIVGLEESLRASASLRALYGIGAASAKGEIVWSPNGNTTGISASNSTSHGGFDNDFTTLNSLARRITGDASLSVFESESESERSVEDLRPATPVDRAPRRQRRRAVCIGIDQYAASPLFGCVNDAREWRSVLKGRGFDTTLLTNGQATRVGLIRAIQDLIDGSRAGDVLVLQYAGHGTHIDDVDGDEEDGQDEALVPFDYQAGNFLIDDDLGELLDRVPAGVNLTCFMDCCHSGTNTRKLLAPQNSPGSGELERFLRVPPAIVRQHVINRKNSASPGQRSVFAGRPEVSFAACRPDQTAKEKDGHGYFTTVATRLLRGDIPGLTHREFLARVQSGFPLPASSQDPQLNCDEPRQLGLLLQALDAAPSRTAEAQPAGISAAAIPTSASDARLLLETLHQGMQVLHKLVG